MRSLAQLPKFCRLGLEPNKYSPLNTDIIPQCLSRVSTIAQTGATFESSLPKNRDQKHKLNYVQTYCSVIGLKRLSRTHHHPIVAPVHHHGYFQRSAGSTDAWRCVCRHRTRAARASVRLIIVAISTVIVTATITIFATTI